MFSAGRSHGPLAAAPARARGLTLLETMLTLALLGILAAIAIPAYDGYLTRANIARAEADLRELALRITRYELDNISLPTSLADIDANDLLDPWGSPYRYLSFEGLRGRRRSPQGRPAQPDQLRLRPVQHGAGPGHGDVLACPTGA
jgi:prepilin-type N-terminal cleavage/methylation domain-containing protein